MTARALITATRVRPPSENNRTETEGDAGTASSATATGVQNADTWFSFVCTSAFNISFSDDATSTVTNPSTNYPFAANAVYNFELTTKNSHFKFTPEDDCVLLWWKSSR